MFDRAGTVQKRVSVKVTEIISDNNAEREPGGVSAWLTVGRYYCAETV